jgi:hypothetical protein
MSHFVRGKPTHLAAATMQLETSRLRFCIADYLYAEGNLHLTLVWIKAVDIYSKSSSC